MTEYCNFLIDKYSYVHSKIMYFRPADPAKRSEDVQEKGRLG